MIFAEIKELRKIPRRTNTSTKMDVSLIMNSETPSTKLQSLMDVDQLVLDLNMIEDFGFLTDFQSLPDESLYTTTKMKENPQKIGKGEESLISSSSVSTQETFIDIAKLWKFSNVELVLEIGNCPTLGTRKPDFGGKIESQTGKGSTVFVGDYKSQKPSGVVGEDFAPKAKVQMLEFLTAALKVQPSRPFVFGVISDCRRFQFFRAKRSPQGKIIYSFSNVAMDEFGWKVFQSFCSMSLCQFGFETDLFEGFVVKEFLGNGHTSRVWSAVNDTSKDVVVCKVYKESIDSIAVRNHEANVLETLAIGNVDHVPRVYPNSPATTKSGVALLVKSPLGTSIAKYHKSVLCPRDFAHLVHTLKSAHQSDVFHNDVAPENMFISEVSGVFLNDFGSAASAEEIIVKTDFISRPLYYSADGFGAAGDLKALVRSVFMITTRTCKALVTFTELDAVLNRRSKAWRSALELAESENYEELSNIFEEL
jgi:hypothetical protein